MKTTVKATYSNGMLLPECALDLAEGDEVTLTVESERGPGVAADTQAARAERGLKALRAAAGSWKGTHDPDELIRDIYEARLVGSRRVREPEQRREG